MNCGSGISVCTEGVRFEPEGEAVGAAGAPGAEGAVRVRGADGGDGEDGEDGAGLEEMLIIEPELGGALDVGRGGGAPGVGASCLSRAVGAFDVVGAFDDVVGAVDELLLE